MGCHGIQAHPHAGKPLLSALRFDALIDNLARAVFLPVIVIPATHHDNVVIGSPVHQPIGLVDAA